MNIPSYNALLNKEKAIKIIRELCEKVDYLQKHQATKVSDLENDSNFITHDDLAQNTVIITANQSFPDTWMAADTMAELISIINNDSTATKGRIYLSTISLDDLPANMGQAEVKVEIQQDTEIGKVLLFTVTSSNISPYHWEYISAYGNEGAWRSFVPNQ